MNTVQNQVVLPLSFGNAKNLFLCSLYSTAPLLFSYNIILEIEKFFELKSKGYGDGIRQDRDEV